MLSTNRTQAYFSQTGGRTFLLIYLRNRGRESWLPKRTISPNICSPKSNYSAYSLSSYYARTSIQGIAVKQVRSSLPPLFFALPYLERGQHLSRYCLQHDQQAKVSKIQERSQCSEWCLSCCRFKFWAQCSGKYSYSIEYFG